MDYVSYADDMVVDIGQGDYKHQYILDFALQRYGEIGLTLNVEKSNSTLNGGKIEFMG